MIFRQSLRKKFVGIFVLMFFVSSLFGVKVLAADTATCATGFTCKCNGTSYPAVNSVVNASGATNVTAAAACNSECLKQFPKTTEWDLSCGATHVNQGTTAAPVAASEPTKTYEPPHLSVPIPGLTLLPNQAQDGYIVTNYLGQYVQAIYRLLIAIVSIGAVLQIMIAGMQWMMARGNASAVSKARDSIVSSLTSIVILLSVAAIAQFIDPGLTTIAGLKVKIIQPAQIVLEETINENIQGCQEVRGRITSCGVTSVKNTGFDQSLNDAINKAADATGVDPVLIATHLQMETGGNVRYGGAIGPCGEFGPSQFMPTTYESITGDNACCTDGSKKSSSTIGQVLSTGAKHVQDACDGHYTYWPPTEYKHCDENICGNCQIAADSCIAKFKTPENLDYVVLTTAKLIESILSSNKVAGDPAMETCAYNGAGKAAAEYAQKAIGVYSSICAKQK